MPTITLCPEQRLHETNLLAVVLNKIKFRCRSGRKHRIIDYPAFALSVVSQEYDCGSTVKIREHFNTTLAAISSLVDKGVEELGSPN